MSVKQTKSDSYVHHDIVITGQNNLKIISDPLHVHHTYCIGNGLWSGALELISFFNDQQESFFDQQSVIELGCGVGAAGLAMALRGSRVMLTDKPEMLPLLKLNISANFTGATVGRVQAAEHVWGSPLSSEMDHGKYTMILAADVCYDADAFPSLLSSIQNLSASSPAVKVILSLPDRRETPPFFHLARQAGWGWRVLRRIPSKDGDHPVTIYQMLNAAAMQPSLRQQPGGCPPSVLQPSKKEDADHAQEGASVPSTPDHSKRVLCIFDFDWSLIEENSDPFVVETLGPGAKEAYRRSNVAGLGWPQVMSSAFIAAAEEGTTRQEMEASCRDIIFHDAMKQALRKLRDSGTCHMVIVSDGNSEFIRTILEHHNLLDCFDEIICNKGLWDGNVLHVSAYHTAAHNCSICPENLCKGKVLERVLLTSNFGRVLYLGDGAGDFCPSTRLGPDDRIISRSVYPKGSPCNLSTMLARESARTLDAASCCQADLAGPDGAVDLQDREVFDRAAKEIASIDRGFRAQPRFWPEGCAAGVVYKWQRPEWAALLLTVLALRK